MANSKPIKELVRGDKLWYIHPLTLKVESLVVAEVLKTAYPKIYEIKYLISSDHLGLLVVKNNSEMDNEIKRLPMNSIFAEGDATSITTITDPPNVYFTSTVELVRFINS